MKWKVRMHQDPQGKGMFSSIVVEAPSREEAMKKAAEQSKGTDYPYTSSAVKTEDDARLDACEAALDDIGRRLDAVGKKRVDAAYERGLDENKPIKVSGVKGMKSTPFTKKFPNMAAYSRWSDKEEAGDYEVYQVEQAY